jgi:hypothetical protein
MFSRMIVHRIEMYNEADLSFKFKDWENLADNPILGELIPPEFADECKAVVRVFVFSFARSSISSFPMFSFNVDSRPS